MSEKYPTNTDEESCDETICECRDEACIRDVDTRISCEEAEEDRCDETLSPERDFCIDIKRKY